MISYLTAYITFVIIVYIGETYLDLRQRQKYKITKRPVDLTYVNDDEFIKAQAYGLDKSSYGLIQSAFSTVKGIAIVTLLFWPWLWSFSGHILSQLGYDTTHTYIQSCIFFIIEMMIETVIGLPWSLYSTFVLEEKHGFNKQTMSLFVTDQIKTIVLYVLIGCPLLTVFLMIVEWGGPHMHIYLWGFLFCVQLLALTIYPTWIQPLFNKVDPLPAGSLRTAIEKLAASIAFPLTQLYVIDGSKRSAHSNAYFYGFFKNKRIVIYDTLITQSTEEEVVAVLGHELGHWYLNHTVKNLAMMQAQMFFMFWTYGQVVHNPQLFPDFGFKEHPTYIGLMLFQLIYSPAQHVFSFLMNVFSRKAEFEADAFAVKLGYGKQLRSGLIKLQQQNKGTMIADPWYSTYHHSHPPILQRLAAIDAAQTKTE